MIIKTYGQKALEIKPIIEKHLTKIIDNIKNFSSLSILDNLTIEICDPSSPDCPNDIKKFAGLTWSNLSLIQLNTTVFEYNDDIDKYYSNLLSHEFGHWWAFCSGFDDINSEVRKIWQKVRGDKEVSIIIPTELIAEDFRIIFGSDKSKGFERGTYTQAPKIQGLEGIMKILPTFTEYKKSLSSQLRSIYSVKEYFHSELIDYFGLMIIDRHNFFFWDYQHYFLDNNSFYKYDYSSNTWIKIKHL